MRMGGTHWLLTSAPRRAILGMQQLLRPDHTADQVPTLPHLRPVVVHSIDQDLGKLLQLSLARLDRAGDLPPVTSLQLDISRASADQNVIRAAENAPPRLGALGPDGVFRPTFLGLSLVDPGAHVLSVFISALLVLTRRYEQDQLRITLRSLRHESGLSDHDCRVAWCLLLIEGLLSTSPRSRLSSWAPSRRRAATIHPGPWCYSAATSLNAYLALRLQSPTDDHSHVPGTEHPTVRSPWLREFSSAAAAGLLTFALTTTLALTLSPSSTEPASTGPPITHPISPPCASPPRKAAGLGLDAPRRHHQKRHLPNTKTAEPCTHTTPHH
jgi:hypothetical protein